MATSCDDFAEAICEKLGAILKHPEGWGGREALEPLVFVLLMLFQRTQGADATEDPKVLRDYNEFLSEHFQSASSLPLAARGLSVDEMVEVLQTFVTNFLGRS